MNQDEFYLLLENLSTEDRLKFFESSKGFFSKKEKHSKLINKRDLLKKEIENKVELLLDLLDIYKAKHFEILKQFQSPSNLPLFTFEYNDNNVYFAVHTITGKFEFKTEDNTHDYFYNKYCGIYFGTNDDIAVNLSHKGSELVNLQKSPTKLVQKYIYMWPEIVDFVKKIESAIKILGDNLVSYLKLINKINKNFLLNDTESLIGIYGEWCNDISISTSGTDIALGVCKEISSNKKEKLKYRLFSLNEGDYYNDDCYEDCCT